MLQWYLSYLIPCLALALVAGPRDYNDYVCYTRRKNQQLIIEIKVKFVESYMSYDAHNQASYKLYT